MDLVSSGSRLRDLGLRVTDPRLSLLGDLTAAGPVRRVVAGRSPARRQTHIGDNQHHVVRRAHDAIEHVACVVGHDPFLKPSEDAGFERERTDVALLGLCPDCRATGAVTRASGPHVSRETTAYQGESHVERFQHLAEWRSDRQQRALADDWAGRRHRAA